MDIRGKTVILTGAARIGQHVAKALKDRGANLVIAYFNNPKEAELGFGVQADVSKKEDIEHVVNEAVKKFGHVDALVHMAAIYEKSLWQDLDEKHWERNMNVIAKSSYFFGKIAGDQMLKNGIQIAQSPAERDVIRMRPSEYDVKGKMIFFSDWSALTRPYKEYLAYNAAKSAVVGLTKSFAKELAPHILVNAIAPGPMLRPLDLTDEENTEVLAGTPLKRWGGAEEITKGVLYLLEADFVTGMVLDIDGGRTIA